MCTKFKVVQIIVDVIAHLIPITFKTSKIRVVLCTTYIFSLYFDISVPHLFNPLLLRLFDDVRVSVAHHSDQHVEQQDRHEHHEHREHGLRQVRVCRHA